MEKSISFDLNKAPADYCPCGCPYFRTRTIVKKIPGLMVGSAEPKYQPIDFLACEKCGRPHEGTTRIEIPKFKKVDEAVAREPETGE